MNIAYQTRNHLPPAQRVLASTRVCVQLPDRGINAQGGQPCHWTIEDYGPTQAVALANLRCTVREWLEK